MDILALLGHILFGGYFLYSGVNHFNNKKALTGYARMKGVPSPDMAVVFSGVLLIAGGAGLLLSIHVQLSALLLLIFMIPTTFMMHTFWKGESAQRANDHIQFMKNVALIGALLMFL